MYTHFIKYYKPNGDQRPVKQVRADIIAEFCKNGNFAYNLFHDYQDTPESMRYMFLQELGEYEFVCDASDKWVNRLERLIDKYADGEL